MPDCSAEDVLHATAAAAVDVLGADLEAVFALGSLAHGGFAPLVSDVDVALVLSRLDAAPLVPAVAEQARRRVSGPLADRLSIFWTDWGGVRHGPAQVGRLPAVDRLDLLDDGRLLHGADRRAGAVPPTADDLISEGAEFALARFDDAHRHDLRDPGRLLARGVRPVTKAVLFPVRFLYTLHTHRIGRNEDAAAWYDGPARPLVAAAHRWRTAGIPDPGAALALLTRHLLPVHAEFLNAYAAALAAEPGVVADLDALRRRLEAPDNT